MSSESGIPTYRGAAGIWQEYNWEEYASQHAFDSNPEKVLDFHELRRSRVLACQPHTGHAVISAIQNKHGNCWIVTQNIDGLHQRAGSTNVVELHGSLWRMRCAKHGVFEDLGNQYETRRCRDCDNWLRPDVTWFNDFLDINVMEKAHRLISKAGLFVSIGTSGVVYPAALFPQLASEAGATCVYINTEVPADGSIYDIIVQVKASEALMKMFPGFANE